MNTLTIRIDSFVHTSPHQVIKNIFVFQSSPATNLLLLLLSLSETEFITRRCLYIDGDWEHKHTFGGGDMWINDLITFLIVIIIIYRCVVPDGRIQRPNPLKYLWRINADSRRWLNNRFASRTRLLRLQSMCVIILLQRRQKDLILNIPNVGGVYVYAEYRAVQ